MLDSIDLGKFKERTWIFNTGDSMSVKKAVTYEESITSKTVYRLTQVPRARHVGEGLLSSVRSSLISSISCLGVLISSKPDLVRPPNRAV